MNSIREKYKEYLEAPTFRAKTNYIWSIAEALQKVSHKGEWRMGNGNFSFIRKAWNKVFSRNKKDYKETYFAIKMPFDRDLFDDLKIIDFSPRAVTGDLVSSLYPSPQKKFVLFARVVGFQDSEDSNLNWGMDYKEYLKKKK